ncbi:unnamed protein product [Paramecium primaurelia]|uniref:Uncharacterized protein n=1 Tax=Paramecium primaurelia TaxID=5886 RepID=A0A8S1LZ92_PARPR|nr:unnamed protein product [Paramecium primaurelia]
MLLQYLQKKCKMNNIVKPLYLKKFQIEKSTSIYLTVWEQLLPSDMSSRLILLVWQFIQYKEMINGIKIMES